MNPEIQLEALKNGSSFGLMLVDQRGHCRYINQKGQEIAGLNAEDAEGIGWLQHIHPDDRKKIILLPHEKKELQSRFIINSSEIRHCHFEIIPIQNQEHKESFYYILYNDNSQLVEFERRFTNFFTFSPELLAIGDPSGALIEVNASWTKLLGYSQLQLTTTPFLEFIYPADRNRANADFARLLEENKVTACEGRILTADGRIKWLQWSAVLFREENLLYISAHDVTEDRRSERALLLQYDLIHEINALNTLEEAAETIIGLINGTFETRLGILWLIDPEKKLYFTNGFTTEKEDPKGSEFIEISKHYQFSDCNTFLGKVKKTEKLEVISDFKKEDQFYRAPYAIEAGLKSAFAFPIQAKDELFGILEFYSDRQPVVDRSLASLFYAIGNTLGDFVLQKRLEKMKNEFVSMVSHELRTPLTSITGSIKLLLSEKIDQLPQKSTKLLDIASRNGERLAHLINDILDIEKMESGKMRFILAPFDIISTIKSSIENNRPFAENQKITLTFETTLKSLLVMGDANRVQQVITNLISNAVKFSPEKSIVTLILADEGECIRLKVSDQGSGIPEIYRHKIFQKFYQVDSSDHRQKEGTGLGLSICKMIIEKLGGTIGFDSSINKGTTFHFTLPKARAEQNVALKR